MIGLVVDEVATQSERMALGERQTETKTFGEVVDFDSYSLKKLISLNKTLEIGQEIKKIRQSFALCGHTTNFS